MWVSLPMAILIKKLRWLWFTSLNCNISRLKLKLKPRCIYFWTGTVGKKGRVLVLTFPVTCVRNSKLKLKRGNFFHEREPSNEGLLLNNQSFQNQCFENQVFDVSTNLYFQINSVTQHFFLFKINVFLILSKALVGCLRNNYRLSVKKISSY